MDYAVIGAGAQSCGSWVKHQLMRETGLSWVQGFVTAMNMHEAVQGGSGNLSKGTDADSMELWVTNYCSANPLKDISDAAFQLYATLKNR
ncbi:hypothetical protein [Mesorhizobium sp. M0816]|uniref:hypothetical protein n=1 Tax=Mesorhizobium sp. M0816 TaxID=2957006 RepID=UPI00333DEA49